MNQTQYPLTGRLGRFVKCLSIDSTEDTLSEILVDVESYETFSAGQRSSWWKNAVEKMEKALGMEHAIIIMTRCGSKCCGHGQRNTARRLMNETGSIPRFLEKISNYEVREGDLKYSLEDDHTIIAEHHRCFCKQVATIQVPFNNLIYCQCSAEFNRQFFTAALARPVKVEILQSIICGSDYCKFKITY
jgi:hypothetical protein